MKEDKNNMWHGRGKCCGFWPPVFHRLLTKKHVVKKDDISLMKFKLKFFFNDYTHDLDNTHLKG